MDQWNFQPANTKNPITLALLSPSASQLYSALAVDSRFSVSATAGEEAEVRQALITPSQVALVDVRLFSGPSALAAALEGYAGAVIAAVPPDLEQGDRQLIRAVPCVQEIAELDADARTIFDRLYTLARGSGYENAPQPARHHPPQHAIPPLPASAAVTGWRCITVWSLEGGVGKTTLARALAMEAAARRLSTLLVGLGAPDVLPLQTGLAPEPNLLSWRTAPTAETLQAVVQKDGDVDLLAGFPTPPALGEYAPVSMDGPAALPTLTGQAAHLGYPVVVLDVSCQELAAPALAAANTLVLLASPSIQGALAAVEAARLAHEEAGLSPEHCLLVVNGYRASTLSADLFLKSTRPAYPSLPELAVAIPDDPAIQEALNARRAAYYQSDALRNGVQRLGDTLFAQPARSRRQQNARVGQASQELLRVGPVVFKRG